MNSLFDVAGDGSAKACWALMRRARADKFASASSPRKTSLLQARCVLQAGKTGHVLVRTSGRGPKASDFSRENRLCQEV